MSWACFLPIYAILCTENSQVVDLVLLPLPHIMVPKWFSHITIWRHWQGDLHIWGAQDSKFLSTRLLWLSTWSLGHCGCCSRCVPSCFRFSIRILHREIKFSETMKEDPYNHFEFQIFSCISQLNDHTPSKLDTNWAAPCIFKPLWVVPR